MLRPELLPKGPWKVWGIWWIFRALLSSLEKKVQKLIEILAQVVGTRNKNVDISWFLGRWLWGRKSEVKKIDRVFKFSWKAKNEQHGRPPGQLQVHKRAHLKNKEQKLTTRSTTQKTWKLNTTTDPRRPHRLHRIIALAVDATWFLRNPSWLQVSIIFIGF